MDRWAYENKVTLDYSRPGKPTDNPFIESFNGSFKDECLNVNWFLSLLDAREKLKTGEENIMNLDLTVLWKILPHMRYMRAVK